MRRLAALLLLLLGGAAVAHAHVDRASLRGTVRDPSGTPVRDASVVLTDILSNVTTRVTATAEGRYLALDLPPGRYLVEAEAAGYRSRGEVVLLEVGQKARLDLEFDLGSVIDIGELLEIRVLPAAETARRLLDTEQAALGTVVEQAFVSKLPLYIRNWDDLLALVPGTQGDRYTEETGGTTAGRTGGVNVNGNRSLANNFLLDGVGSNTISTNVQELSTQVSRPSIDSIQEFKVVTSPDSAEYGRAPGAAISVTTKSGGRDFRGTLYEYLRNDAFDSSPFFTERAGLAKPRNDQHQFGANLGGPLRRDRAFFFLDYEGTRIARGVTRTTRVPTAEERRGSFTQPIVDPLTRQPFPGNTIPAERLDPIALKLLALLPLPNADGVNNFVRQADVTDDADRVLARLDLKLSDRDTLFGRYIHTRRERFIPGFFGGTVDGTVTSAFGRQHFKTDGLVLGWTRRFGASLTNELRVAWSRSRSDAFQEPFGRNGPELIGLAGVPDDPRINGGVVGVNMDGFGRIGSPNFLPKFQHTDQVEYLEGLTWLRGEHQLRFGLNVVAPMKNEYMDVPATRGDLRFRGRFTGHPVADLLLGYVSDAELSNVYLVDQRYWSFSLYVQDDWKANERLSLNLGLRHDFITPALEAGNRQSNFDPATASLVLAQDGSLEERGLVKPDWNNVAPRVGVVYKLGERTVLRGGYGLYYNLYDRLGSEDQLALNPPGLRNNSVAAPSGTVPVFFLRDGFPPDFLARADPSRLRLRAVARDSPKTEVHQLTAGFQRRLGAEVVLSADVALALGRHLTNLRNLNQPQGGSGALPFAGFGPIEWRESSGRSRCVGLDLSLERRFTRGLGLLVRYTLSDSVDQSTEHLTAGGSPSFPQDARDLEKWDGPSDFDTRHRFVGALLWELPFGEGRRWARQGLPRALLGGWLLGGIVTARSGRPFTVTQGSNNVGALSTGLPDRVGSGEGPQQLDRWFDLSAFPAVPSGSFGDSGRNILRGPDWRTLDLSLQRRLKLSDRLGATFRWDVFNVLNRANFGLPDANISSPTAGMVTTLAGDPRIMQFSLRLDF